MSLPQIETGATFGAGRSERGEAHVVDYGVHSVATQYGAERDVKVVVVGYGAIGATAAHGIRTTQFEAGPDPVERQIRAWGDLPNGWDGPGSVSPPAIVVQTALLVYRALGGQKGRSATSRPGGRWFGNSRLPSQRGRVLRRLCQARQQFAFCLFRRTGSR